MWDDRGLKCSWVPINLIFYSSRPWNNDNYVKNCNLTNVYCLSARLLGYDWLLEWMSSEPCESCFKENKVIFKEKGHLYIYHHNGIWKVSGMQSQCSLTGKGNIMVFPISSFNIKVVVIPGYCGILLLPMVYPHFHKSRCYNHNFLCKITCDEKLFLVINCTASLTGKCMMWKIIQDDTQ